MKKYTALVVTDQPNFQTSIQSQTFSELLENQVLVKIAYSDINFKDALATQQKGGVIRSYPMIPGIDLAGEVVESKHQNFASGDKVVVTGYGLGVSHPGGFSDYQQVPGDWLVSLPKELSEKQAMQFGTAGFTAGLAVAALEAGGVKKEEPIFVTGASGGVGSCAIAMLKKLGYQQIIAVSRKEEAQDWLKELGASDIVPPESLIPEKIRPLAKQQLSGLIDTVGGELLTALLPQLSYGGTAALCGNAAGIGLETTVLPFILRGIRIIGIDSVNVPMPARKKLWQRLATDLNVADQIKTNEITLVEAPATIQSLLAGTHQGRTIIKM
ncbi:MULTISPECIES: acrylyl-CoA reductase family protein [Enterococcus]|uniref:acrylyl-CoA reductase family protein n=1 Tax=Enterococcus TaxID=1350 RepID=UPI0010F723D0|nr:MULTISPECIES: acryloyl-CoA reductase [Enterococcus]KAF1300791.1 NADPH:quinone reductase [Enterococcus sp. JM9B]